MTIVLTIVTDRWYGIINNDNEGCDGINGIVDDNDDNNSNKIVPLVMIKMMIVFRRIILLIMEAMIERNSK